MRLIVGAVLSIFVIVTTLLVTLPASSVAVKVNDPFAVKV
jgi:hypothetical protein